MWKVIVLTICAILAVVHGSAIPMWEYLSKDEKMSYLYSMFESQVGKFCETNTLANCRKELLKYGVDKLKDMPEDHLDTMDPAQRDAHDIIWDSMMEGHEMMKTPKQTTTKPNSYEDDSFDYGLPSAKLDNVYKVPPPPGFVFQVSSGEPLYTYPQNFQYVPKIKQQQQQQQSVYQRFQQQYPIRSTTTQAPLVGPMVVKVYPDGRPVYDNRKMPEDDDLKHYQLAKAKIPNL